MKQIIINGQENEKNNSFTGGNRLSGWLEFMGVVYTNIKVRNVLTESKAVELKAKVDTGTTLLVIPGDVAKEFEFPGLR